MDREQHCDCGHGKGHHHHHKQEDGCHCGHDHQHATNGCGYNHHHGEGATCGCGHDHHPIPPVEGLTALQQDLLLALYQRTCLPVACFGLTHSKAPDRYAIALAPVYIGSPEDELSRVKALGAELATLEEKGLLTLDYDMPIGGYAYGEYKSSQVYAYFVDTVAEGAKMPNCAFDTPALELGSMALTQAGEAIVAEMLA